MASVPPNPYPRSPNQSTRSYDSSVSSAASPNPLRPPLFMGGLVPPHSSRMNATPPQPIGIPPPVLPPVLQSGFQPYTPMTANPMVGRDSTMMGDHVTNTPGLAHAHLPSSGSSAQKRAYRQRRKDPSCDACRERKVKCDATETSSCSECSTRNVKCQFTKETNRRMSSIKQVQDLERQLERVRRENLTLQRLLRDRDVHMDLETETTDAITLLLPDMNPVSRKRKRFAPLHDMSRARANVQNFSRGVWKAPAPYRLTESHATFDPPRPDLPSRQTTDNLLYWYHRTVHHMYPILDWPAFLKAVDEAYRTNTKQIHPAWLSLFFAVLAAGSLFCSDTQEKRFFRPAELLETSRNLIDPWNNSFVLDNARTFVLITICLNEMNLKSAACAWLGIAISVGEEMELNWELDAGPSLDAELSRRVWWSMYVLDRSLSTELGRPLLLDDTEHNVALPGPDSPYTQGSGPSHSLTAIVRVVRVYTALSKTLSTSPIATTRLATFDQHFVTCLQSYPAACDPSSPDGLSVQNLNSAAFLLHARILLHRQNLSPECSADVRRTAIEQCMHVSLETFSLVLRLDDSLADGATALLVTHLFRTTLFLLFTSHFEPAMTCIRALRSIGSRRDVNTACGRYLTFFVSSLNEKRAEIAAYMARTAPQPASTSHHHDEVRTGPAALQDALLHDEELLAYVSADLQAQGDGSWVWSDSELQSPVDTARLVAPPNGGVGSGLFSVEQRTGLTEVEVRGWGGWERLEASVRALASGNATPTPTSATWATPHAPIHKEIGNLGPGHLPPQPSSTSPSSPSQTRREGTTVGSADNSPLASSRTRNQDRISIANII